MLQRPSCRTRDQPIVLLMLDQFELEYSEGPGSMATHAALPKTSTTDQVLHQGGAGQRTAKHQLFPINGNGASTYQPLSSVWEGSDGDLLEAMFKFYATIPPEP